MIEMCMTGKDIGVSMRTYYNSRVSPPNDGINGRKGNSSILKQFSDVFEWINLDHSGEEASHAGRKVLRICSYSEVEQKAFLGFPMFHQERKNGNICRFVAWKSRQEECAGVVHYSSIRDVEHSDVDSCIGVRNAKVKPRCGCTPE